MLAWPARAGGLRRLGATVFISIATVLILPATAGAAGPTTWKVNVGAQTSDEGIQANAFLAGNISIDEGDAVSWTARTGEIHTVTFLSGGQQPPLIVGSPDGPTINPVVAAPAGGPNYDGTGYVNSGLVASGAPAFSLTFTKQGDYDYLCQVHPGMVGTVHVAAKGTAYPHPQAYYDGQGTATGARLIGQGQGLQGQGLASAIRGGVTQVTAGVGELFQSLGGSVFVARFQPDQRTVRVGQTVTWTNRDPNTPHTVTFGQEPPNAFLPSNVDPSNPSHATLDSPSGSTSSGVFGAAFGGQTTFSVTLDQPGTYSYICALHDDLGMKGTIVVTS